MSWFSKTFSSSIGRKLVVAVTGLFLCSFLVVHLIGNLQLFKSDGGASFNIYSHFMATNPIIRTMEIVLLLGFVFHIYQSLYLNRKNNSVRKVPYAYNRPQDNSNWSSRSMGLLGTVILLFLIIHLYNFFWRARFGEPNMIDIEGTGYDDLYSVVVQSFQLWWYVLIYVVAQIALGLHLYHGFSSAFHTLGLNHKKYTPAIQKFGAFFSIVVPAGFASMPLYFFIQGLLN
ncbi:succinate dehydrogenase cytochrome b subunit [Rufibacter glacialis]|uniref:Succinate dehydrogenase cytochrome b subunit n=1 Tax=Rufibacter glacialis TaxID=1259555 RepID=A0A5M8QB25_9BACT|nr:succinate dehydrogenase cytochrome b subunit [Rufibacter glacialis]KAA6432303.1 succinate dehydrogenase cytochrome b subunit [Rufibacter glacialis]